MLLLLEHTFLLLSHPSFTTKVFPVSLRFHRHSAAANPVGEDVSGVLVTPSALRLIVQPTLPRFLNLELLVKMADILLFRIDYSTVSTILVTVQMIN